MRPLLPFTLLAIVIAACVEKPHPEAEPQVVDIAPASKGAGAPIAFDQIDDNIAHDTLLIQTTFDLRDGTYIMIAAHAKDDERAEAGERTPGLRLYHYRLKDGMPQILATSSPAYDSWTLFPTFFNDPLQEGSHVILANLGERNSWGQKVIRHNKTGFQNMGFLNVAAIETIVDEDGTRTKLPSIAPHSRITSMNDELIFSFDVSEIMLFDDLQGGLEQTLAGDRVTYRWNAAEGLRLFIDGDERREQLPS